MLAPLAVRTRRTALNLVVFVETMKEEQPKPRTGSSRIKTKRERKYRFGQDKRTWGEFDDN